MISYCDKYVQIKLFQDSKILSKVLAYAEKHFSRNYRLSSSILILDDGEIIKKNYLINWCYHAMSYADAYADQQYLKEVLAHSHLPIRIKMVKSSDLLEKISVKIQMLGAYRIVLTLSKRNRVAERYIKAMFGEHYIGMSQNEIYLQSNIGLIAIIAAFMFLFIFQTTEHFIEQSYDKRTQEIAKKIDGKEYILDLRNKKMKKVEEKL